MLNISYFDFTDKKTIFYEGKNHYYITQINSKVALLIESLDDDFEIVSKTYSFSTISSAIAGIEALENGEEI